MLFFSPALADAMRYNKTVFSLLLIRIHNHIIICCTNIAQQQSARARVLLYSWPATSTQHTHICIGVIIFKRDPWREKIALFVYLIFILFIVSLVRPFFFFYYLYLFFYVVVLVLIWRRLGCPAL